MSALPKFTMRELLDAGVHFGHKTLRWNPKMSTFLYGVRNDIHIIDLQKTVPLLHKALKTVFDVAAGNGRVLFVGTKKQASESVAESAKKCGQYYINHRWLGGLLTNWNTVSQSIKTLKKYEADLADESSELTKKEKLKLEREIEKLEKSLGGIKDMGGRPDLLFIVDTNKEDIAVKEAQILGIPIVAIVDSNSNPDGIDFPIPGNDDASRAIKLYCDLVSEAVLRGLQASLAASGVDMGESANLSGEAASIVDIQKAKEANSAKLKAEAEEKRKANRAKKEESSEEKSEGKPAHKGKPAGKPAAAAKKAPVKAEVVKKKSKKISEE